MEHKVEILAEIEVVELIAFLVTSARGLVTEPQDYGPMRLMAAASWVSEKALPNTSDKVKPLLSMLVTRIPDIQRERRRDPSSYVAFIDECCREIARYLMEVLPQGDQEDE